MDKIVCIGDSLTYGYGVKQENVWHNLLKRNTGFRVLNRGVNGDGISGVRRRFDRDVVNERPDICFMMIGTNDLIEGAGIERIAGVVEELKTKAVRAGIEFVFLIPPYILEEDAKLEWNLQGDYSGANKKLSSFSKLLDEAEINYIDMHAYFKGLPDEIKSKVYYDGIHLNKEGNGIFYRYLKGEMNF